MADESKPAAPRKGVLLQMPRLVQVPKKDLFRRIGLRAYTLDELLARFAPQDQETSEPPASPPAHSSE